ncbi:ZYRO0E04356p [Zygosaccharomyces rouxii]|uniref:Large ribosomal subunit protein bL32m n=2 Tax=Zygosaccharomyces rouxii TaxID=4956 RepID=C5E4A8_ZYGRC|nr:mitochondrial 54S ribosomal protein YmL32 [Zygosaccharomyces rouxii]KAH9198274.1 mitochondrial 54S ribosomal protein YmL32 [Zygosaccharomyces rouxii]CAQ43451.1 54S ribosomal protein L32 [Zygosaccharomyces rouxii]CAR30869.1 ZYRO0E04356p [Zygosaccharomyces rouxii]
MSSIGFSMSRFYLSATTLLPWVKPLGGPMIGELPKQLPESLRKWIDQRTKKNEEGSIVEEDFFSNNGRLLAVPKKKVTHQKKRQRLYAPGKKQLKFIHELNKCPSCGHYKRANCLCMHCVQHVRHIWKTQTVKERQEPSQEQELSDLDKRILYPGKKETEYNKKLKDKDSYLERRMRTLPVEEKDK